MYRFGDMLLFIKGMHGNIVESFNAKQSKSPYSVRIQENKDQKKLRIWTLFMQ